MPSVKFDIIPLLIVVLSLLALAVGLVTDCRPVEAQTAYAVSNLGQDDDGSTTFSSGVTRAQGFETGPHLPGYDIDSVVVSFNSDFSGSVRVSLWDSYYNTDASARRPNSELFTFNSPASLTQGDNTFTAPDGSTLEPNATYFVIINNLDTSNTVSLNRTTSAGEDSNGLDGWTLWDRWASRTTATGPWPANPTFSSSSAIQLGIVGAERNYAVSNLGQDDDGSTTFSSGVTRAQGFETGPHLPGYDIDSVVVSFNSDFSGSVRVSLWDSYYNTDASARRPNSELFTFNSPASLTQGDNAFTAPDGSTLEPNATYFVIINNLDTSNTVSLDRTTSADEDSDGLDGWSLWDLWASRTTATGPWPANPTFSSTSAIQLGIVGAERDYAVSNLGQDDDGSTTFSSGVTRAQGFETGPHSNGYDIERVVVSFNSDFSGSVRVSLWDSYLNTDASARRPNSELFTFNSPASLTQGDNTFTAPKGSTLEPDATYFVIINNLDNSNAVSLTGQHPPTRTVTGWTAGRSGTCGLQGPPPPDSGRQTRLSRPAARSSWVSPEQRGTSLFRNRPYH